MRIRNTITLTVLPFTGGAPAMPSATQAQLKFLGIFGGRFSNLHSN